VRQCVAVCGSVLQCVATCLDSHLSVLHCVAVCVQRVAVCLLYVLQCVDNVLQCVCSMCCKVFAGPVVVCLKGAAVRLQCAAERCSVVCGTVCRSVLKCVVMYV